MSELLGPKVTELIGIAINASTTHLHERGVREHVQRAIEHGATREEIVEVLQIISVIGIHSCALGIPILMEELEKAGLPSVPSELTPEQQAIKDAFVKERGYWAPPWEALVALDPGYFAAYAELSGAPWRSGPLEPKVKELIFVAHSSTVTNMHPEGLRAHIGIALRFGATRDEILEVFKVVGGLSQQSMDFGLPILDEYAKETAA